jgi:hypothetical protein
MEMKKSHLPTCEINLICPITKNLMAHPVRASDGQIYDRAAIQGVIDTDAISPVTGQGLLATLEPCKVLQNMIIIKLATNRGKILKLNLPSRVPAKKSPLLAQYNYSSLDTLPNDILGIITQYLSVSDRRRLSECGSIALLSFFKPAIKPANAHLIDFFKELHHRYHAFLLSLLHARPDLIAKREVEITKFLMHVVRGEILPAQRMLKHNLGLLLLKGQIIDCSGRCFLNKGITALQYALAAHDYSMVIMLLNHFIKSKKALVELGSQYRELAEMLNDQNPEKHRALKNLNNSIQQLHDKLTIFANKYKTMTNDEFYDHSAQARKEWCIIVGGAQRMLPGWVVQMMCEEGQETAWVNKSVLQNHKRDSKHFSRWFAQSYPGIDCLGKNWAVVRGTFTQIYSGFYTWANGGLHYEGKGFMECIEHDKEVLLLCQQVSPGNLPELETLYYSATQQSTSSSKKLK